MFEISENNSNELTGCAKIRVVGIGGGGCNAVNTMIQEGLTGVEYIVANTDLQSLNASKAPIKVQLGAEITKGLGAGANPEIGRKAALDEYEKLTDVLQGSDMVFITAGMGGGTGTGAAPIIAKLAKELGALTVGVVTKPFLFEGKKRSKQANEGIIILEESVDSLITIPNQRLLFLAGESLSLIETFKKADDVLLNAVRGISDLINKTGHINADFADVSTVMANKGLALMGTGTCSGEERAIKAATEAISSPLLEDITIDGATGIIVNITGSSTLSMHEANEAATLIMEAADEDAEIIFGTVIDDNMGEDIKVTVIATGLGGQERVSSSSPRLAFVEEELKSTNNLKFSTISEEKNISIEDKKTDNESIDRPSYSSEKVTSAQPKQQQKYDRNSGSLLLDSIKEAATKYEATKSNPEQGQNGEKTSQKVDRVDLIKSTGQHFDRSKTTGARAKSIAEKLGFINFDEEELDTPSYLRKESVKKSTENTTSI